MFNSTYSQSLSWDHLPWERLQGDRYQWEGELQALVGVFSWPYVLVAAVATYVTLCSALRFRRLREMEARYGYTDRASLARMTNADAQAIVLADLTLEFPLVFELGGRFAIIKVSPEFDNRSRA
ncbi:hypothetical protein CDD83_3228 [Cordyceps sp. RAO-2017]|nr:hypothetical protein CDD83_3228 [Cordyceps sp. RAO-2017]